MSGGEEIGDDTIGTVRERLPEIQARVKEAIESTANIWGPNALFDKLKEIEGFRRVEVAMTIRAALQFHQSRLLGELSTTGDRALVQTQYKVVSFTLAQIDLLIDLNMCRIAIAQQSMINRSRTNLYGSPLS